MTYTISVGGKTYGPATLEQLQELVNRGRLAADDFVWDKEAGQWMTLGSFPATAGLFAAAGAQTAGTDCRANTRIGGYRIHR